MVKRWYEQQDAIVPWQAGALQLLDLATQQACPMDVLLRKTKLFAEDLNGPAAPLQPWQLAQMYHNASVLLTRPDLPLVLGQQLLPSGLQQHGIGLVYAPTVVQALDYLLASQSLWAPLLHLQAYQSGQYWHLYMCDSGCALSSTDFAIAAVAVMEALRAVLLWLGPQLDDGAWQFELPGLPANMVAECQSRWARSQVLNDQPRWSFSVPKAMLAQPLPQASISLFQFSQQQVASLPLSLLGFTQQRLQSDMKRLPALEALADEMGISPATLKRKLKAHGTSYQKQVDQARCLVSDHYSHKLGYSTEQVAEHLNFYDSSNLRRAMKRWILAS